MNKSIFSIIIFAAILCACTKEDIDEPGYKVDPIIPEPQLVFTATMEEAPSSKATFDNTVKCASWEAGDQISVNGFFYEANADGASTTFSKVDVNQPKEIRPVFVSSTNTKSYENQPASNLVDVAGTETRWIASNKHKVNGVWNIVVSTTQATQLKTIKLWNADNQSTYPGRSWKSIKVYGSTSSNSGWTELKSIDNLNLAVNNKGFAGEIEISATNEYIFYRIDILDNEGDEYMQMSDMKFVIIAGHSMRPAFVSSTDTGSFDNQPASNLVDASGTDTRWIADKTQRYDGAWNIVVSTNSNTLLKSIKLWNADNQSYPERRWKSIKVYGSTVSQSEWSELKSIENLNLAINNKDIAGEIKINASNAYSFYKIDILDNEGDNYMQMSDMKFDVNSVAPYYAYFPANLYDGITAVLPASIYETWADGKFNMPMYAHSENTELQFKNLCGVLKIIVKNDRISAVKSIRVSSANKAVSGAFTVVNNTAVLTSPDETANTVTVTYTDAVPTSPEGTEFYVAIPAQTYRELKIELSPDGENFTKLMITKEGTDIVVARNKIYPINHVYTLPTGALSGEFTVNSEGKKVHFSKGNLQATFLGGDVPFYEYAEHYSWGFAKYQYECIGNGRGNTTIDNQIIGAIVDLFGWSAASLNFGISTSESDLYYRGPFEDWGQKIGDGNTWRTLTKEEWEYLIHTRTVNGGTGKGKSYSLGIIYGGKMGLVLYPDNYTGRVLSGTVLFLPEGVVFLPAAGKREGSYVGSVNNNSAYWTATGYSGSYSQIIDFHEEWIRTGNTDYRYCGNSVRLVTDSK